MRLTSSALGLFSNTFHGFNQRRLKRQRVKQLGRSTWLIDSAARAAVEPLERRTMLTVTPLYWDPAGAATASGGSGTWDTTTAEWRSGSASGPLVAWSNSGDANGLYEAVFPSSAGTVTLSAAVTAASLSFTSNGYSLSGGSSGYSVTLGGTEGQIDVANNAGVTISAAIYAGSGLTKTSAGTLSLSGTLSGTAAETLDVQGGTVNIEASEVWQTVTVEAAGSLTINGSDVGLIASSGINVYGLFDHEGGSVQTPTLANYPGATFHDGSGSVSGTVGSLTIYNAGTFDSVSDQSLSGTTGTFYNGGTYKVENLSGSGTTTLSMPFYSLGDTIDVTSGTLSLPGSITLTDSTVMTLDGSGMLSVPSLDVANAIVQQNSGTLNVTGSLQIGDHFMSGAQYNLGGGLLSSGALFIGSFSTATFSQTGGALDVGHSEVGSYGTGYLQQTGGTSSFGDLYLGFVGTGTYNLSGGSCIAYSLEDGRIGSGSVNLSGSASLSVSNIEGIGQQGGYGIFTQTGSSTNTSAIFAVGDGGTGVYNLSAGTFTTQWDAAGEFDYGAAGIGTFIQSGGIVNVQYAITIGSGSAGSSGTYLLSAGQVYNGYSVDIGIDGGHGTFNQSGGTAGFFNGSILAGVSGTSATVDLSGGSLTVSDNAYIGYSSNASFMQTGGAFSVDGDLIVSGDGWTADPAGNGTFLLSGTGQVTSGRTFVGYTANATFAQSGGTHTTSSLVLNGPDGSIGSYNQTAGTLNAAATYNVP